MSKISDFIGKDAKAAEEAFMTEKIEQFTDCDNCQRNLSDCECGENQMPVCNICAFPQVNCVCDEPSYLERKRKIREMMFPIY